MQSMSEKAQKRRGRPPGSEAPDGPPEELVDRLAGLLPAEALQDALEGLAPEEITGAGGLLSQLAGRVVDAALAGELSEHLGYPPGQEAVRRTVCWVGLVGGWLVGDSVSEVDFQGSEC